MNWLRVKNNSGRVTLNQVPQKDYVELYGEVVELLSGENCHVGHYFGVEVEQGLRIYCMILDDSRGDVMICSHLYHYYCEEPLASLTAVCPAFHPFEREITELYGLEFKGSTWNKPLRFSADRKDRSKIIENYPFYHVAGETLHEVNVGPIHAGVIEPGAFRFICNGEKVHHLEIALGYQHRGVETLIRESVSGLRRMLLVESVVGDSAVSNAMAYANVVEQLAIDADCTVLTELERERVIALELERVAVHIGDVGALCMDIGYQLGQVACEALRTIAINTTQLWCGNRFGKGLVRPLGSNFPLTEDIARQIANNMAEVRRRFNEIRSDLKNTPSLLARFEECGVVDRDVLIKIGAVGVAARAAGVSRDIRLSHPYSMYAEMDHLPIVKTFGDVMSRMTTRLGEVFQSIDYIDYLLSQFEPTQIGRPNYNVALAVDSLAFSFIEGWRGELAHVALTNSDGLICSYKIKDPSLHNWLALALAVRDEGISDFPICNKSFNLSYCGNDL